jgi:hypothetical protein
MAHTQIIPTACRSEGLADILERVLDKGVVIAGDIRIKLCDIELLSIQIRLLIASVDKAQEMGLTWWWQQPQQQLPPQPASGPPVGLPHFRAQAASADGLQAARRAEPVEDVFAQLSQPPRKQKGPCDGQNTQGPVSAPAAR